jgi:hypothetical protein
MAGLRRGWYLGISDNLSIGWLRPEQCSVFCHALGVEEGTWMPSRRCYFR